ncbi:hypothetical protein QFZ68_007474 [Streptomyces sp. V1I6]|nr:hypothetical protein [Streptomyces sp. V1I6]
MPLNLPFPLTLAPHASVTDSAVTARAVGP